MATSTYLLFILGCLGAADIALFHTVAHGIRSHPDSRTELISHSLRGPTYAALFVLVPNIMLQGSFAWLLIALLVLDVGISVWDFAIERSSREFLGGLPSGEYVLHTIMAMIFGAFAAHVVATVRQWATVDSGMMWQPADVPAILRLAMGIMAVLVMISGVQDAIAAIRLRGEPRRRATI